MQSGTCWTFCGRGPRRSALSRGCGHRADPPAWRPSLCDAAPAAVAKCRPGGAGSNPPAGVFSTRARCARAIRAPGFAWGGKTVGGRCAWWSPFVSTVQNNSSIGKTLSRPSHQGLAAACVGVAPAALILCPGKAVTGQPSTTDCNRRLRTAWVAGRFQKFGFASK